MLKNMSETRVYKLLEEKGSVFKQQIDDAINYADNMLPQITNVFNTYTIHGMRHSINVVEYMYDFIEDITALSDLELVMMIFAALFHDIGMVATNEEIRQIKDEDILIGNRRYSKVFEKFKDENVALQECIRPIHGLRSKEFIENINDKKMFIIPDTTQISFQTELGLICQAHTEDFSWITNNLQIDLIKGNFDLNAQFIAVLLRLADYLDIDEQRTPMYLYQYLKVTDYSNLEWQQHFNIENFNKVLLDEKTNLKEIVFQGQSENPTVHRKLLKYFDLINTELLNAVELCEKYQKSAYLLNIKTHVINKLRTEGFTFSDFRLSLDYSAVTNLLMGEHIYGDKKYGLREIIQNSIDACKVMQEIAENHSDFHIQKYEPFISIMIDKDRNQVTILDNGIGMSVEVLKKYFLNVGVSYYESDDYILQGKKYSPIGHYGIGFLACFMLSNKIEVRTRNFEDNQTTKIEFERNSEYICLTYENIHRPQGTEITFDYQQFMDVFDHDIGKITNFIAYNFLDCGIPIKFVVQENGLSNNVMCCLKKTKEMLGETINLSPYLNGIEAYIECGYMHIKFAHNIQKLNGCESYYYYADENVLKSESEEDRILRDCIENGQIEMISIPIIDSSEKDVFLNALEMLEDFDLALEKIINYRWINIIPTSRNLIINLEEVGPGNYILGDYDFEDFCIDFGHSRELPTYICEEVYNVVSGTYSDKILPYNKGVKLGGQSMFDRKDKVYIKNVLLSKLKLSIPFLVDGIIIKNAVVNINNKQIFPNVSRDDVNEENKKDICYAIGKAFHLWMLENLTFTSDERKLLNNFIELCYPHDNYCLKQ